MKFREHWVYFLFGALSGAVVGFMKSEFAIWLMVGSALGLLVSLFFGSTAGKGIPPEKLMWVGFFLMFPIIFFDEQFKGSFWYDVFGILAVIGSFTVLVNVVKIFGKLKKLTKS